MNAIRAKSFFSIFLSLMLFCIPLFAQEAVQEKNIFIHVSKYVLLCGVDLSGIVAALILVTYAIHEDGQPAKKCFYVAGFALLGQSCRGLFYDAKKICSVVKKWYKNMWWKKYSCMCECNE